MTKLFQRLLGGYLALCLVLAGTVGLSPLLHQLVEHGGRGPLHTHAKARQSVADSHWQAHDRGHSSFLKSDFSPAEKSRRPLAESVVLASALGTVTKAGAAAQRLADPDSSPMPSNPESGDDSNHEHHSLSQLLVNGLVDFPVDGLAPAVFFPLRLLVQPAPPPLLLACEFDSQTASRGPPSGEPTGLRSGC